MSMSRKDYEAIAAALQRTHQVIVQTPATDIIDAERHVAVDAATRYLADTLAADNPRFDRERFLAAAHKPIPEPTYKVTRFFQDLDRQNKVLLTGLTLDEAQAHCQRDDTHGDGWFDGYDVE